jgi:hypothetical protein
MKRLVSCIAAALLAMPLFLHAQGTTYFSTVGVSSAGHRSIASDSWVGAFFITGPASAGYSLQSIQLLMGSSSGSPAGLSVRLWDFQADRPIFTLSGPDPTSAGLYTYTASDFIMPPGHVYWFVVRSETPAAAGTFTWLYTYQSDPYSGFPYLHWSGGGYQTSSDGLNWTRTPAVNMQFAVNAIMVVPEPSAQSLLELGALLAAAPWLKRARGSKREILR